MNFKFVKYGSNEYPDDIKPELVEIAGHLDKQTIERVLAYSLHTEYSYGRRKFDSPMIRKYPELCEANRDGVPQLWKNERWAIQFADFILDLTQNNDAPIVVEIHPPFSDYCDLYQFIERYHFFENCIHSVYPNTEIVIENRAGSMYHGGRFIVSKAEEISLLCRMVQETNTSLGVVLDFPQLLTAENIRPDSFDRIKYSEAIDKIYPYREIIKGIHIWGKKKNASGRWIAHNGTLDTFIENSENKKLFIEGIKRICSDDMIRFFVPEVNSGEEDLKTVVRDILME